MSNDKNSQREATLMALDQLAQTLEVMNSLVRRLKLSLDQTQADASPAKPKSKPQELESVNRVQPNKSPINEKPTVH
ncbi:hypothetical protein [uncultured Pseudoteredinibacter sp.]|uniref:hypothetical protein n=1 Tax=uncultured Pseudoteredinibacter sp. TaxID=1641701 RepID=UPI0026293CA8|nr:hypothetical protein [uncultured Pseudoteredinibacter sp.]